MKPYAQTKFYHTRQDSQRTPKSQYNNIRYSKHDTHKGEMILLFWFNFKASFHFEKCLDYTKNCGELNTAGEWDDVKCDSLK